MIQNYTKKQAKEGRYEISKFNSLVGKKCPWVRPIDSTIGFSALYKKARFDLDLHINFNRLIKRGITLLLITFIH